MQNASFCFCRSYVCPFSTLGPVQTFSFSCQVFYDWSDVCGHISYVEKCSDSKVVNSLKLLRFQKQTAVHASNTDRFEETLAEADRKYIQLYLYNSFRCIKIIKGPHTPGLSMQNPGMVWRVLQQEGFPRSSAQWVLRTMNGASENEGFNHVVAIRLLGFGWSIKHPSRWDVTVLMESRCKLEKTKLHVYYWISSIPVVVCQLADLGHGFWHKLNLLGVY